MDNAVKEIKYEFFGIPYKQEWFTVSSLVKEDLRVEFSGEDLTSNILKEFIFLEKEDEPNILLLIVNLKMSFSKDGEKEGRDFITIATDTMYSFENRDQIVNNDGFIYGHIASSMITQANMQTVDLVNEILLQSELNGQLLTYNLEIDQ